LSETTGREAFKDSGIPVKQKGRKYCEDSPQGEETEKGEEAVQVEDIFVNRKI
jgi:hypothetical protein